MRPPRRRLEASNASRCRSRNLPVEMRMLPTSMCGKPLTRGFRTVLHSDRVCRAVPNLQTPPVGTARQGRRQTGDFRQSSIAGAEGTRAIFGGFPRLPCRSVLTMSAYAYQEASSLVLAGQ